MSYVMEVVCDGMSLLKSTGHAPFPVPRIGDFISFRNKSEFVEVTNVVWEYPEHGGACVFVYVKPCL